MREIKLSQGKVALVDKEDYDFLSQFNWNFNGRYAKMTVNEGGKYKTVLMHSLIMNTPKGKVTDHINGDKLDNRKENLRIVSQKKNMWNGKGDKTNPSGYKGVTWYEPRKKWRVRVNREYVGLFDCKKEAAKAYNEKAKELQGEFAYLNEV